MFSSSPTMMKISDLLNAEPPARGRFRSGTQPSYPPLPRAAVTSHPRPHRPAKDAALFVRGETKGDVHYPPHPAREEIQEDEFELRHKHEAFRIEPIGRHPGADFPHGCIIDYPRHIPYNSGKKQFQMLTGRESFEVLQYTFRMPGKEKDWQVLWDYQTGLVRVTPFFKALGHPKTVPGKAIKSNEGLSAICHSITGGALAAQGYWVPYEAARALAAKFCYEIRYCLTPLFGRDFVHDCTPPGHPDFGVYAIDPAIVQRCAADAERKRMLWSSRNTPVSDGGAAGGADGGEVERTPRSTPFSEDVAVTPGAVDADVGMDDVGWMIATTIEQDALGYITDVDVANKDDDDAAAAPTCSPSESLHAAFLRGWTPINTASVTEGPSPPPSSIGITRMLASPSPSPALSLRDGAGVVKLRNHHRRLLRHRRVTSSSPAACKRSNPELDIIQAAREALLHSEAGRSASAMPVSPTPSSPSSSSSSAAGAAGADEGILEAARALILLSQGVQQQWRRHQPRQTSTSPVGTSSSNRPRSDVRKSPVVTSPRWLLRKSR